MHNLIVFIHGSGDSSRSWRFQLEELGKHYAVFAIDLPGHGQRPDSLPLEVTVLDYAKVVHDIIQDELHLDSPIIGGHSLGGAIALTMALEYGAELGGLILIGTGARLRVLPALLESARLRPQEAQQQVLEMAISPVNSDTLPEAIRREQEAAGTGSTMLYRDLAACNTFDCMPHLAKITLPTLIICGEDDQMTPLKYSQYLHQHIQNSILRVIPHAGHYVMREQPGAVNAAIQEWMDARA